MKNALILLCMISLQQIVYSQKVDSVFLYPEGTPGLIPSSKSENYTKTGGIARVSDIQNPMMYVYTPKKKKSDAVVLIFPGGGYSILAIEHEGHDIAKWFNKRGMTAVVVKNRLPKDEFMTNKEIRPLQDAQQAIRIVRKNAVNYGIDPNKIGIMGFSAGGHLASTAGTHFETHVGENPDVSISVRPDFMILIYPVISFNDRLTHSGSRDNLIGVNPTIEKINEYSNEKHVDANTPPTFLISTSDDFVKFQNSVDFFVACKKNKVPAEMHIYESGGHGYGITKNNRGPVETWDIRLEDWLKFKNYLSK